MDLNKIVLNHHLDKAHGLRSNVPWAWMAHMCRAYGGRTPAHNWSNPDE